MSIPKRLAVVLITAVTVAATAVPAAPATEPEQPARDALSRAERDVATAQAAANAAAAHFQRMTARQAALEAAEAATTRSIEQQTQRYSTLRASVRAGAVATYKGGGTVPRAWDLDAASVMDSVRRDQLSRYAFDRDRQAIADAEAAREDLEAERRNLEARRREQTDLAAKARASLAAITRRLEDARQAQSRLQGELRRAEEASRARRLASSAATPTRRRAAAGLPAAPGTVVDGLVCPIAGPRAFANDWMASRPGGASHQGTDIFSARGTPNVAVVAGTIVQKQGARQGNGIQLSGDDGTLYYYFHLDSYAGSPRRVTRGEVIAYTGSTGESGGAVHTHFEIHPGHGAAVNPYPTLRRIC